LQAGGARSIFLTCRRPTKAEAVPRFEVANALEGGLSGLQKTLEKFKSEMDSARDYLVESVRLGHPASPAAQWVIDNAYLIKLNLERSEGIARRVPQPAVEREAARGTRTRAG
jgi:hypothetical protein